MTLINCPVCLNTVNDEEHLMNHKFVPMNIDYKLYHCPSCHIEFWSPMEVLPEFYEKYLPEHEIRQYGFRPLPIQAKPFFKYFPLKKGTLLDVGCGDGIFLKYAQEAGFTVTGLDFDEKCIKTAKENRGIKNVYKLSLDDFADECLKKNLKFDVICFFEVLEHQDKPKGFLGEVCSLLNEGGYIVGSVPNRERFLAGLERKLINGTRHPEEGDYPPPHLTYWSKDVLKSFVSNFGFDQIEFHTSGFETAGELAMWFRHAFLGNMLDKSRSKIKSLVTADEVNAAKSVEILSKSSNSFKIQLLKIIKRLSQIPFYPAAVLTFKKINQKGIQIYFQAEYRPANVKEQ